jgi:RHS repeat-associated protein
MNMNPILTGARTFLSALSKSNLGNPTGLSALLLAFALQPLAFRPCQGASFPGNARVEMVDATASLSWTNSVKELSVQCWFKLNLPSDPAPTENMTILVNRRTGTTNNPHAFHLWYDISRKLMFSTRGSGGWQRVLIDNPSPDRWYHVAVVRANNRLDAWIDGRPVVENADVTAVGDARSTDGVSIGGWGTGKYLNGEVQEVSIYQAALSQEIIVRDMYTDQPTNANPTLKGYFKMGFSQPPGDRLRNLAAAAPADTHGAASGTLTYEETDRAGEQSSFDARRNGGAEAIAPLSGSFSWGHTALARPVPGIPFDFQIGYGSVNASGGFKLGSTDPFAIGPLGNGWRHAYETRVIPATQFSPLADADTVGVLMWNGSIETWDRIAGTETYTTRRKEYRGELTVTLTNCQWVTPERLVYTFRSPQTGANTTMRGRLMSIRDPNGNQVLLEYDENLGRLTNIVLTNSADTVRGRYVLNYVGSLLQSVSYGAWLVQFTYDGNQRLLSKNLTNTSVLYTNVPSLWRFNYYTSGTASNFLQSIVDPRGNTNVTVAYDGFGRRTNTADALGRTSRVEYGVPGKRQITTTDAEGYKWIATHDRSGRPIAQRNPLGHESRSTYDERGNRMSTTDPLGNLTLMAYDNRANLIAQTNAMGEVSRTTYHSFFNKPLTETDPLGWVTTNVYDGKGNLLSRRDAFGTLATYTYTASGLVATETDANGNTNHFAYNASGFRVTETDAAGFSRRMLPNDLGWTLAVTNALGEVTTYAYDLNGKTVLTLDPLGRAYTATYDANGNLLTQTDPKGQQARYTYNALDQKATEVDRNGGTNRFAYTPRGKPLAITNALGRATLSYYDAANRETNTVDALGHSVRTVYDANGNAIAIIDSVGQRWTKVLDRLNRAVAVTDPLGNTTRTIFDAAGRVRETITPDGASTTHRYDGRGRMIARTNAAGSVWRYDYDGAGNITNITDALGGHYVMAYGPRHERVLERNQDGKEWHYNYDALLRLKTQQEPNGNSESIEYDAGSRILVVNYSTGRINSFLYDDNDNPVVLSRSGSGPATISQLAYDALDRVQQYTDAYNKTIRYLYDTAGRLTSLTYPDGRVLTNRYDALDRLTEQVFQFSAQQAFTNTYAYDPMGRLIRRGYPNGIVQTNTFDIVGRLTGLAHAPISPQPSKLNLAFKFAFDRNGNTIQSKAEGTFAWPVPAPRQELARFTPAARLIERSLTLTGVTNPQPAVFTYQYDPSGNMTNAVGGGQTWRLTYDEENRTTSIHWDSGFTAKVITNRYDALGRRIARTVDGILTSYVLDLAGDRERILCDLDASRTITGWYVHGADLAFKVSPDGSLTCYHPDAQGNIVALTDGQANTIAEYAFTPFGRSLGSAHYAGPVANPYLFAGSQGVMEELPGLYFMRARYYSADAGVFLSTDPVKNIGPSWVPVAYAYAENNPLRFNDPDGEFFNFIAAAVGAVVGAIVNAVVEVVTQLIENKGDFGAMNWGKVGIAAGVGAVQGAIAGLTGGASIAAQMAIGAVVGGVASVVQTGLGNLTEGKAFAESWESVAMDFGVGAATGAIPGGGKGKPKPGVKAPKAPGVKSALARAKTSVPLRKAPQLTRSASAPAALLREGASQSSSAWKGHLWDATKEVVWGVGSGIGSDKLNEFLQPMSLANN